MSLIKWKPLNNEIDTFDNIIDQFSMTYHLIHVFH